MWLPDTNVWIALLNPPPTLVKARFQALDPAQIFLCDVVKMELYYGAYRSGRRAQNLLLLEGLFASFTSLPFDGAAARACGELRAALADQGKPIGPYDSQIAAIALTHQLMLVTHNTAEFGRVAGLTVEDWEV